MSTNQQVERVRSLLQEARSGVHAELAKCEAGQPAIDIERNLRWIASSLDEMIAALDRSERQPVPGLWHVVSDTWPHDDPLGSKIIDAEYSYERLR
ncbi:hypothetical protein Psta_3697 [Pirellula staleyi DSM 6068]|uniref:Uncharacterized protein n=1 Tax=Pirellula staleyi (strain ATCC 27377 / DSM 6068 / ICPB 4128) TaxID=530564 RepID=D2QZZ0_PIRSD|nr:hypothetical protein Psta_3697 [Pirellula staleyi DSM 6068]